jgi:hypothetical protein
MSRSIVVEDLDDIDALLKPIFLSVYDKKARITVKSGKTTIVEFTTDYKVSKSKAYELFRVKFVPDSNDEPIVADGMTIRITISRKLRKTNIEQNFREGDHHCVFTPLIKLWSEPAKTKSTTIYNAQVLKRINKLATEYGDSPVPQQEMEQVAKKCETTFRIRDPIGNDYLLYNKGGRKTLYLQNSRMNHVDETNEEKEISTISHAEAITYVENLKDGDILEGTFSDPIRIHRTTDILEITNPMKTYIDEIHNLIPDIKFDATQYPDVNDYILESRIINSGTLRFQEDFDEHYDLEKAYTQFHQTKYYKGFLGVIHQWRNFTFPPTTQFLKEHNGIYKAKIIAASPLAKLLGFIPNNYYILPLPEWTFHKDNGTTFTIVSGVFGSTFDFRFPPSSLQEVPMRNTKTNKPFRIFAGQLSSKINQHDSKVYNVKADERFAGHLASLYPEVFYDQDAQLARITVQHKKVFTKHHLFSFITSYTRIVMMEEMLKFNIDNLSAVTLDGLYFKGKAPKNLIPQFRPKQSSMPISTSHLWYIPTTNTTNFPLITSFNQNTFLEGPGGSGKTHTILNDKGFNNVLYASPTHELGRDKVNEYNLKRYTTVHKLAGIDASGKPVKTYQEEFHHTPSVIFIDELTQIEAHFITKIISLYTNSLIFIAGDVDATGRHFQCKYSNEIWKPTFNIHQFTTDYRSKSPILTTMKQELREYMKTDPTSYEIKQYVKNHFKTITKEQALQQYTPNDVWIAGTHKYIKTLHPLKIHTTHSYQGKTITSPTKLYISIDDMFEHTMFYTAMSRVQSEEQLIIVRG